ncbi:MAG TPA: TetR/AcrR family transcriptional regulator [Candidatus Udaeobacter sp.]|nr:TetR/AcrR family transcriptional regulator [Candidatus Udaeobacter sp.]
MSKPGAATKARIEAAALSLFVEQGVDATGIRDISQAVGLSDGALYRHFRSKDELVWRLFREGFAGFAAELERLASTERRAPHQVEAMVRGLCALYDADSLLFRFLLLVQHRQLQRVKPGMANPVESVRAVIARGMKQGEIASGDPDLATAMVMGLVLQTATFKVYGRISRPMTALAPALAEACRRVLGPGRRQARVRRRRP